MIEIEKAFSATAQSPWHFLNTSGQGCYIPPYQRNYSWDEDNVDRLFEDALHGINMLLNRDNTISFLGTIIAIHDTKFRTVKPIYRQHVAPRVMTIIDGQQRICTFVMLNIAFHDYFRRELRSLERRNGDHFVWLVDQCKSFMADLEKTFQLDMSTGDKLYRYYPRITRAYDDAWSKRATEAQYTSAIARLIWEYVGYANGEESKGFKYQPKNDNGRITDKYTSVVEIFSYAQREIQSICGKNWEKYDFPDAVRIAKSKSLADGIWGFALPDAVTKYLLENSDDRHYQEFVKAFRMVILSKYMNYRMAFTIVTTESEDDAFDMFEALNTTGEPLTAFETFKPRVIDEEKLEAYELSPSRSYIQRIEDYLEAFRKADSKQKATTELLVPFALAETGEKLQKRLSDQRRYLRDEFEEVKKIEDKRDFVFSLANLATFMKRAWDIDSGKLPDFEPAEGAPEHTVTGFLALQLLKHGITVAPISRFYDQVHRAEGAERAEKSSDLFAAIDATVAFSMLYRAGKGGTENIDSHYRDVMRVGIKGKSSDGSEFKISPLAKRPKDEPGVVSLANYKRALRHTFTESFATKEDWIKAVVRSPIYNWPVIARFVLLCASHDAAPDTRSPGLVVRGRKGLASLLTPKMWAELATVEHIAPQNPTTGWDASIMDDPDRVHRLGNLTLLPAIENSVVGNRPWEHKHLFYRMLAAETAELQEKIKEEGKKLGLVLSTRADHAMVESKFLGLCTSLSLVQGEWTKDLIEARSRRLAELAWEKLAPYLDLDS